MKPVKIKTPLDALTRRSLKAGDEVLLSGKVLTARDAAHKRLFEMAKRNGRLPRLFRGALIYYCGPTPRSPGRPIGSCGPTTSSRMDAFTPALLGLGVVGMIGKGARSGIVRKAVKRHRAIYLLATGGIGALLATKVKKARAVLFKDLGPEAVYEFDVRDFPLTVGIDSQGGDIYT